MDPRKYLKRLARELGLLRNDATPKPEKVSGPANFEHRVHVALDEGSGGFVGLPPQWKQVVGKTQLSEDSPYEKSHFTQSEKTFRRRRLEIADDFALDHGFSRTSSENLASFAASLETPRSRASVADSQDLIIERLKRELREYKARNSSGFDESSEDLFKSSNERIFNSTQSLNIASHSRSPYRVSATNRGKHRNQFVRPPSSESYEFDESLEDEFIPKQNERRLATNRNIAQSLQSSVSPVEDKNANGSAIPRESPTKLNGHKPNGNPKNFRRSESEV